MATNMYKKYTEAKTREWVVPAGTQSGDAVINAKSGQVGVALTSRGDSTTAVNIHGVTGGTIPNGGVGNRPTGTVVAVDGTWRFAVTGSANGDTGTVGAGTPEGTKVYAVVAAGVVTSLTLTVGTNVFFGVIDDGVIVGNVAPVLIGAVL